MNKPTTERTKIARLLWEHEITYRELAEAAGLSQTSIFAAVKPQEITELVKQKILEALNSNEELQAKLGHKIVAEDLWQ